MSLLGSNLFPVMRCAILDKPIEFIEYENQ